MAARILHVEDDPNDVLLLSRAYRKCHFLEPVLWANSCDQAKETLASLSPPHLIELIVSDIKMPGGDGFALLKWAKENAKIRPIPFVFLTSSNQPCDRKRALDMGCDAYIVKPNAYGKICEIAVALKMMALREVPSKKHR